MKEEEEEGGTVSFEERLGRTKGRRPRDKEGKVVRRSEDKQRERGTEVKRLQMG